MQPTSRFLNNENTLGITKPHAAPHCRQRRIPATWLAFQSLHRLAGPPTSPPPTHVCLGAQGIPVPRAHARIPTAVLGFAVPSPLLGVGVLPPWAQCCSITS